MTFHSLKFLANTYTEHIQGLSAVIKYLPFFRWWARLNMVHAVISTFLIFEPVEVCSTLLCCDLPFCLHIIFLCMHMLKCINITAVLMFG